MEEKMNTYTQEELRARFNPDGSLLRRQQMRLLDMIVEFDAVCKEHDIPYWLSSGNALGCVRHKGFIPWDDDMDIEMLREDYERLVKILPAKISEHLVIQNRESDPNYFFPYPKIRDLRSHLEEVNGYDKIFKYQGIYIDIFVFENMPLCVQKLASTTFGHIYKIAKDTSVKDEVRLRKMATWYNLNEKLIFPVMRFIARFHHSRIWQHILGTPYHGPRCLDEIFPLTTMEYEGIQLPMPHDADKYLRRIFGDYMQLPNLEDIHPHWEELTIEDW